MKCAAGWCSEQQKTPKTKQTTIDKKTPDNSICSANKHPLNFQGRCSAAGTDL